MAPINAIMLVPPIPKIFDKPNTILKVPPNAAPADTPNIYGSASGFLKSP